MIVFKCLLWSDYPDSIDIVLHLSVHNYTVAMSNDEVLPPNPKELDKTLFNTTFRFISLTGEMRVPAFDY